MNKKALTTVIGTAGARASRAVQRFSMWGDSQAVGGVSNDNSAMLAGMRFFSTEKGKVTHVRYYVPEGQYGERDVQVWDAQTQQLLGSGTNPNVKLGWNTVALSSPVDIEPNKDYIASFRYSGNFVRTTGAMTQAMTQGPLVFPANDPASGRLNGVFRYGSTVTFPHESWNNGNHWVDVVLEVRPFKGIPGAGGPDTELPEVWVSESHSYNEGTDRMDVTWALHLSKAQPEDMGVSVSHARLSDGAIEHYTWTVPAGQAQVAGTYSYGVDSMAVEDLVFRVNAGGGYTVAAAAGKPSEVAVNLASQSLKVWVGESHVHSEAAGTLDVTWALHLSRAQSKDIYVSVSHSRLSDGTVEDHSWHVPAGHTSVSGAYSYQLSNMGTPALELRVNGGEDYTVAGTPERPSQVSIDLSGYVPGDTGGGTALEAWVSHSHTYVQATGTLDVTWTLHLSQALTEDFIVAVTHSRLSDGVLENYNWTIPAGRTSVSGTYGYKVSNMAVQDLEYRVNAGQGYTVPGTAEKPSEAKVNISSATGSSPKPPALEAWASQTHTYVAATGTIDVTWALHLSQAQATDTYISVSHSRTSDGVVEHYTWTVPAGHAQVSGTYRYATSGLTVTDLEYRVHAGEGYSVPNTDERPALLSINVAETVGSGDTGGGDTGGTNPPADGGTGKTARAIPDPNSITYSDAPIVLTASMRDASGVIRISGKRIQSTDGYKPCIDASSLSTRSHIIIEDCILRHSSMHIFSGYTRHTWEVRNCFFFGRRDVANNRASWGRWGVRITNPYKAVIEHNYFQDHGGVRIEFTAGVTGCEGFKIRYNRMKNVYQPDGLLNYISVVSTGRHDPIPNQEICWNECLNVPGQCWVEDTINIYAVVASASSPGRIHNNFLDGAHKDPNATRYTGGGIILDGTDRAVHNWVIEDNIGVRQCNYVFAIACGDSCTMRRNKFAVAARFADGTPYKSWTSGMWTDDYSRELQLARNNQVYDNIGGVVRQGGNGRQDYSYSNNTRPHTTHWNNQSLPDPINRDTELALEAEWVARKNANGVVCGPVN